jgi:hypothetical protein
MAVLVPIAIFIINAAVLGILIGLIYVSRQDLKREQATTVVLIDALNVLGSRQHLTLRTLGVFDNAMNAEKPYQAKVAARAIHNTLSTVEDIRSVALARLAIVGASPEMTAQINFDPDYDPDLVNLSPAGAPSYPHPEEG